MLPLCRPSVAASRAACVLWTLTARCPSRVVASPARRQRRWRADMDEQLAEARRAAAARHAAHTAAQDAAQQPPVRVACELRQRTKLTMLVCALQPSACGMSLRRPRDEADASDDDDVVIVGETAGDSNKRARLEAPPPAQAQPLLTQDGKGFKLLYIHHKDKPPHANRNAVTMSDIFEARRQRALRAPLRTLPRLDATAHLHNRTRGASSGACCQTISTPCLGWWRRPALRCRAYPRCGVVHRPLVMLCQLITHAAQVFMLVHHTQTKQIDYARNLPNFQARVQRLRPAFHF